MIQLLSGGLDSILQWRLLNRHQVVPAITFNLGTKAVSREAEAIRWAADHFKLPIIYADAPMAESEAANGWVDFRNSILLLLAAQRDPDGEVALGACAEVAPDKNERFYRRLERAVNMTGVAAGNSKRLKIMTPYADLSKGEALWLYDLTFGASEARLLLDRTWSCYMDGEVPCLQCGSCRQRIAAEWQYAHLSKTEPPPYTAERWRIPWRDRVRWVLDNGWLGVQQIRAHQRMDGYLPVGGERGGPDVRRV